MKKIIPIILVIIFFASCRGKTELGKYRIEKNSPTSAISSYAPQMSFWDNDNNENIFTVGYFNSSLEPTSLSHIIVENEQNKSIIITEFIDGYPRYTYTKSTSNILGKFFIEYLPSENLNFVVNIYDCDWEANSATVLRTAIISKNGEDYTYNLVHQKNTTSEINLEEDLSNSISYSEVIGDVTSNFVVKGIEWIVNSGHLIDIVGNTTAEGQLASFSSVVSMLRTENDKGNFDNLKEDEFSSLNLLLVSLSIDGIKLNIEETTYKYFVTTDDYTYPALKFGESVWTTKNLKTSVNKDGVTIETYFYNDDSYYENTYSRLYKWDVAQNICPNGWHLPSSGEWNSLITIYGGKNKAAAELIEIGSSQFKALFSGFRTHNGNYSGISEYSGFWTSDEYSPEQAYIFSFSINNDTIKEEVVNKNAAYSVRCIRDY